MNKTYGGIFFLLLISYVTFSSVRLKAQNWSTLGIGVNNTVYCTLMDDGNLYVGGQFT
ncbi:MAG: hypothetical protein M3R17_08900 [Bacteroidota bacterium]|nr:hypothetical protein [Bacteroidota bacterium]